MITDDEKCKTCEWQLACRIAQQSGYSKSEICVYSKKEETLELIDKVAKLAVIWVRWNDPVPREGEKPLTGDQAMHEIHKLFKDECAIAWDEHIKQWRKHEDLELKIKHEMLQGGDP